jgi:hypothetical protein
VNGKEDAKGKEKAKVVEECEQNLRDEISKQINELNESKGKIEP